MVGSLSVAVVATIVTSDVLLAVGLVAKETGVGLVSSAVVKFQVEVALIPAKLLLAASSNASAPIKT